MINSAFDISRLGAGRLAILIYHRVLPYPDRFYRGDVDRNQFGWQMRVLKQHFNVLPLEAAIEGLYAQKLPPRAVCITFDDGYADNYDVAVPILKKYGLNATFFVATGYLDGGAMFNDIVIEAMRGAKGTRLDLSALGLETVDISSDEGRVGAIRDILGALKYRPVEERQRLALELAARVGVDPPSHLMLSTAKLQRLAESGMVIGGHTVNHPILGTVSEETATAEMAEGREWLQRLTGQPVNIFAYPNGIPASDYRNLDVNLVKKTGFRAAVSTSWAAASGRSDRFQLPRLNIWDRTPWRFRMRILKSYLGGEGVVV